MRKQKRKLDDFWRGWVDRFTAESDQYITPRNRRVKSLASRVSYTDSDDSYTKAKSAWLHVYNNMDYELSKRWYTPEEVIKNKSGDCEDFVFLLASVFPNLGITESEVVAGILEYPDGRRAEHVWNRIDGRIVDATGRPSVVANLKYHEIQSWTVIADDTR